jgi:hypothetical protein
MATLEPTSAQGSNRLALVSLVLALVPLVPAGLAFWQFFGGPMGVPVPVRGGVVFAVYVGGLAAAVSAVVTGVMALRRAKRYQPGHKMTGLAVVGLVLGTVDTLMLLIPATLIALLVLACTFGNQCI